MTLETIFIVVQALVTVGLGILTKHRVIPSNYVPVQNTVVGLISALIAVYYGLFGDILTAILSCLAISLGVGGGYDLYKGVKERNL